MSSQESLVYFGDRRTDLDKGKTFQGVETPSQVGKSIFKINKYKFLGLIKKVFAVLSKDCIH